MDRPISIWCLGDGKAGHVNQVRGLCDALGRLTEIDCHTVPAPSRFRSIAHLALRRFPPGRDLPNPDLILAAGHGTHLGLLAARRARGGRAIVLMRPSLPLHLFDLCLIPRHDHPPVNEKVIETTGVLNRVRPPDRRAAGEGLILLGGPSAHHDWSDPAVLEQLATILDATPQCHWHLTTSRRTPASVLEQVQKKAGENLSVVPVSKTPPDWVPQHLARAQEVWVTEDSVSMIYEALTAGAAVGLIQLPRRRGAGRVIEGIDELIDKGMLTCFDRWRPGSVLPPPAEVPNEAERCARLICERFLSGVRPSGS
ncbi:MAG: mitochondrial fission ELM1 family protein [Phycisphaerae bacterium]|nr:mitochondrial fission ELM1 family protein [Phycisphaerae bacterium]